MKTIVAASKNQHKLKEIEDITKKYGMKIVPRDKAGIPDDIEIVEDGKTFEENSLKKAKGIMELCGEITIADDSGLMVDYLDGAPGVYSARFAGEQGNDAANNAKLLKLMDGVPYADRRAKFVSVITMVFPDGKTIAARGECYGHILTEPAGENGFGYDPLFVPEGYKKTFAQLTEKEKNQISHRAMALKKLEEVLKKESIKF